MKIFKLVLVLVGLILFIGCGKKEVEEINNDAKKSTYNFIKKYEEKGKNSNMNERLGERNK